MFYIMKMNSFNVRSPVCRSDMDTTEGQKKVLMMAKERENNSKDIYQSKVINYEEERVLVDDLKILESRREYVLSEADERREPKRRKE